MSRDCKNENATLELLLKIQKMDMPLEANRIGESILLGTDSVKEIIEALEFKKSFHPADVWEAVELLKEMQEELNKSWGNKYKSWWNIRCNKVKQTLIAQAHELAEVKKEYIPVKVEHLYLVNKRKKLFAGNCPICKSWVSEEFADMGDKEMRYCYRCGNELNFKGAE